MGRPSRLFPALLAALAGCTAVAPPSRRPPGGEVVLDWTPAAPGRQIVRFSTPAPEGWLAEGYSLSASDGRETFETAVRALTWHPAPPGRPRSIRRTMVTFVYRFSDGRPVRFALAPVPAAAGGAPTFPGAARLQGESLIVKLPGVPEVVARLIAPPRAPAGGVRVETVESNRFFLWQRLHLPDPQWPRVIELRADALGGVVGVAHLQRRLAGDDYAPDFGWEVLLRGSGGQLQPKGASPAAPGSETQRHAFGGGGSCAWLFEDGRFRLDHPSAPLYRRGDVEAQREPDGATRYRYLRCRAEEKVPMQEASWRRAELVIGPSSLAPLGPTLASPGDARFDPRLLESLYDIVPPPDLSGAPELSDLLRFHRDAVVKSMAVGDDCGNVTSYTEDGSSGASHGMNRLNHAPALFEEAFRGGDRRLLDVALLWCDNFYDQSIWWGAEGTGGTRYNNVGAKGRPVPDNAYMWRSNTAVTFCTKGFESFFLAYETTGDPRMREAMEAQVRYSAEHVHADQGEARNVGVARDFARLYRYTGERSHLDQALRLFRELRGKLSTDGLFSQGGKPIEADLPFIDDDALGLRHPFAKPYILGYALEALPELARHAPDEPGLRETIAAVADFMAASQDLMGGWRYPHPQSSRILMSQALEHAWQLTEADRFLGPQERHLDAVERVLRQRFHGWKATGTFLGGLTGWEYATGRVRNADEIHGMYRRPEDRDPSRDYAEGRLESGGAPPEAIVYLPDVLARYLERRPASRFLAPPDESEPLGRVLLRGRTHQTTGVRDHLPVFRDRLAARRAYPLAWAAGPRPDFEAWRREARAKVMECLLEAPPPAPFDPVVLAEEDRGSHVAGKVVFNLTADSRVLALMLVPKGAGPFPAVLLLHDHGARFDIGKEKVIRTWNDPGREKSAQEWVGKLYGGRYLGDELARRGYVCLATDALNWSDRGGGGYEDQQALASNLLHLGSSFAGLIAHEDQRAAEFLATRPEVDARRVAAMGLSMGGFRAWQLAAISDRIAAGAAVGWMATAKGLMVPGNNQAKGCSAFAFVHPGLFNWLDYPDVASLACPKPMLFYNGTRDPLFPVPAVREAFAKMRGVWESQKAGDRLETRLWDVPHVFDAGMQDAAFAWLEERMR